MLGKMCQIWRNKKFADFMLQNNITRENARACACASFFAKCLKMASNVCKKNLTRFWAFLFFARALTRGRTHARAFSDLKLTGRILTLIMINMNRKCLSVMKIWSWVKSTKKNTKWRLDDVMKTWWPWKWLLSRLMTMSYDCAKIERNWPNWSWVILYTKKCGK